METITVVDKAVAQKVIPLQGQRRGAFSQEVSRALAARPIKLQLAYDPGEDNEDESDDDAPQSGRYHESKEYDTDGDEGNWDLEDRLREEARRRGLLPSIYDNPGSLQIKLVGNTSTEYYEYLGTDPEAAMEEAERQGLDMRDGDQAAMHFRNTARQRRILEERDDDDDDR